MYRKDNAVYQELKKAEKKGEKKGDSVKSVKIKDDAKPKK